jgi:serine-type D-Ala-D-Ala carboxypeptidase (penicillin-binding protein 5/6)
MPYRLLLACWIFIAGLASAGFGPPVMTDGRYPPLRLGLDEIARLTAVKHPPELTAKSALLVDQDSGQTLFALHPDDPLPPASTAKLMTALIVLQQANLDDVVTISPAAAATQGSRMGLTAGETLTVRELLYGLLLPSGNDAAVALAEHIGGSEADFVDLMNRQAASMGLKATHFAGPHGMDADGQTSSATDLLTIAQAALKYPLFAQIVATPKAEVGGMALTNTNELLGKYPGIDGIKTGTSDAGGECLVVSVTRQGHRLLGIVLGSQGRYADMRALLDYAESGWQWTVTTLPDSGLAWVTGSDGKSYRLHTPKADDIFLPAWQRPLVQPVRRLDASVPLTSTLPVGELQWVLAGATLASAPLTVLHGP